MSSPQLVVYAVAAAFMQFGGQLSAEAITLARQEVSDVTPTAVTLHVKVTSGSDPAPGISFEYGIDSTYGTLMGPGAITQVADGVYTASLAVGGLTSGTIYHYRAVANDGGVLVYEGDQTFKAGNQPPNARDDEYLRRDGMGPFELFVLGNDFDSEEDSFHIVSVTQGLHGTTTITGEGQTVSYQLTESGFAGDDVFTYTIVDSAGATATANVIMRVGRLPVSTQVLFATGDDVPGAGRQNVPAGAKFVAFGIPSLTSAHQLAFLAQVRAGGQATSVIIGPKPEGAPTVIAAAGDVAPNFDGTPMAARFVSFSDPLLNAGGVLAFQARYRENERGGREQRGGRAGEGIWTNEDGLLRLVTRVGEHADGAPPGAVYKTFKSLALGAPFDAPGGPSPLAFVAQLARGPGGVSASNDLGLWRYGRKADGSPTIQLLVRQGDPFDFNSNDQIPARIVQSFTALQTQPGAAGHGFGLLLDPHTSSHDVLARLRFTDGTASIAEFQTRDNSRVVPVADSDQPGGADVPFDPFLGIPTQSSDGQNGFIGRYTDGPDGVKAAVWVANDLDGPSVHLMRIEGDEAPDTNGAKFRKFTNVVNNGIGVYAFTGTLSGNGIRASNDTGIWLERFDNLHLFAQEGAEAPGADGAKFERFLSLAMPGNGRPFLKALVRGARGSARGAGLWFTDDDSAMRLLTREGDTIPGAKGGRIRLLRVLEAVPQSPAQTRSFDDRGEVLYRVSFFGGRQAIVLSTVPGIRE